MWKRGEGVGSWRGGTKPPKPHVSYGSAVSYVSSAMAWRDDLRALRHRLGRAHARGGQSLGLREAARAALCAGDRVTEALALARAACRLHTTPRGQRLLALALLATGQMAEACELIERLLDEE